MNGKLHSLLLVLDLVCLGVEHLLSKWQTRERCCLTKLSFFLWVQQSVSLEDTIHSTKPSLSSVIAAFMIVQRFRSLIYSSFSKQRHWYGLSTPACLHSHLRAWGLEIRPIYLKEYPMDACTLSTLIFQRNLKMLQISETSLSSHLIPLQVPPYGACWSLYMRGKRITINYKQSHNYKADDPDKVEAMLLYK